MHQHNHCHEDHHDTHHHRLDSEGSRRLKVLLVLTLVVMGIEFFGGYITNSLSLMSDAGHMLTDSAALAISLFAFYLTQLPPSDKKTYGFHRAEILAALINGIFLLLISMGIIYGAWNRLQTPQQIMATEAFFIATVGLCFNLFGIWFLRKEHHHPNIRGAMFHLMGDALGSVGAMSAALLAKYGDWLWADPLISVLIALIIVVSAFRLISDTTHMILDGTPQHLDTENIRSVLTSVQGVEEIHDLHVWNIAAGIVSLSVHVVANKRDAHELLCHLRDEIKNQFGITHVTIQIEEKSLRKDEPQI